MDPIVFNLIETQWYIIPLKSYDIKDELDV